jgi:6-phosphogluconolactonase
MTAFFGEFKTFEDSARLVRELTDRIRNLLDEGIRLRGQASLVVSGGTTPVPLFELLSHSELAWNKVVVTLADERWVETDDPDSNELLVRTHLLKNRAAAAGFIGLKTPDAAAAAGENACHQRISRVPHPFDVLILGMGGDGHTASLFPGSAALPRAMDISQKSRCMAVSPPAASHDRMTLTLPALLDSRHIIVHITGASKRQVFEKAIAGDSFAEMPIRAILAQKTVPVTVWWAP